LPPGLSPAERSLIPGLIEPQWVSPASLQRLEQMGLPEEAIHRVLDMMLNGLLPPPTPPASGPVAAALALLQPSRPATPEALAHVVTALYEQNERFLRLRPQLWLTRLDELAETVLPSPPVEIDDLLQRHLDSQWILIDCLGLALLKTLRDLLPEALPHWKAEAPEFARVSERTSTNAFYLGLIGRDFKKAFEKIDAVDALIHERKLSLPELARLARAELEISFKRLAVKLDRALPILVFGDHGFRMRFDGGGFVHGGPSTLERIVPVINLDPW
jgi:hypothetical protein